jgi:hypothetical protein
MTTNDRILILLPPRRQDAKFGIPFLSPLRLCVFAGDFPAPRQKL